MANTATPSALDRAILLQQSRKDERKRFMATFGLLSTALVFGSIVTLIYSDEHKWMADNLYTLVLAVNNETNIKDITSNYTRVIKDTAMETLLTDVLPFVNQSKMVYCSGPFIGLVIVQIVLLGLWTSYIITSACSEHKRYQTARNSPYTGRALMTALLSFMGLATGLSVTIIVAATHSTLTGWDFETMCFLGAASGTTFGAFLGQAIPEKGGNDNISHKSYEVDRIFLISNIFCIAVSVISGTIICKSTATTETAFIVALQELRRLVDSKSLYEDVISPAAWATFQSEVLPYVSADEIKIYLSTSNVALSIIGLGLTGLGVESSRYSVALRRSLKIVPEKRNLSILASLAAGLVVTVTLLVVFFVLVKALEEDSSWYHLMDDVYAFFILSSSFAVTGLVGAAIPCRRGEDAVQRSDSEAAGPAIELRAVPPQTPAVISPVAIIAPLQKSTATIQVLDLGQSAGSSSSSGTEANSRASSLSCPTLNSDALSLDGVSLASLDARLERGMAELVGQESNRAAR
ncbi:hypothetical protein MMC18_009011 [Xylographa bjoerkii]|nr:hypothetical protein [Xylographa bjoerkii]MCJ1396122.1 hypothetical protein [Xylographa bjoerkii]